MVNLLNQKVLSRSHKAPQNKTATKRNKKTQANKQKEKNLQKQDIYVRKTEEPIVRILHVVHMFMTNTFILYIISVTSADYCDFSETVIRLLY